MTISRTIAQKKPQSFPQDPLSPGPSSPSIPTDPPTSSSMPDPNSVVVFALNGLTNRLNHFEKNLSDRISQLEQSVQSEHEGTRATMLRDLQSANKAASYCQTQMDFFLSSLGEIATTAERSLNALGDKVSVLGTEVGDLVGILSEIRALCRRGRSRN